MTTGVVPVLPKFRFTTPAGVPYSGGSLTIYLAGTTTLATTYLDSTLSTPGPNPITLDSNGECTIWASPGQAYKWLLKDSNNATVSGWPVDNISVSSNASDVAAAALVLSPIASSVTAVAAIASSVTTVAGNAAAVTTVAGISTSVSALAPQAANIGLVGPSIDNVNAVAANIAAVNQALTASATSGVYPNAAASNVPRGLTQSSVGAITAGASGTNGTFAVAWSGGNFTINPTATFTVSGGALTAVTITGPGLYIGSSPTVPTPSFAASTGLTGAAVVLTAQFLVTSGQGYWVQSADGLTLDRYNNVSGVATADTSIASIPFQAVSQNTTSPIQGLRDSALKSVELVNKSGDRFIAGMTAGLQKTITDLQAHSNSYQQRDQLIAETSRDPNLVTYTLFDWSTQPNGTLAFAPAIVRTGHNTAFVACERRNLPGGGSGDDSVKNIIGKIVTYDRATRTVSLSGEITVSNSVPVGTLGPGSPTLVYVNTGTNAGRLYCWYYILTSDGAGYFSSVKPMLRYSDDKGATWSAETDMSATFASLAATIGYAPGPGHGIQLDSGRLVVAFYLTNGITSQKSFLLYSDDGGTTWTVGPVYQRTGSNECSVVDLRNGELLWIVRTTNIGKRHGRVDATTMKVWESSTWRNAAGNNMLGDTALALETGCHQCENPWDSSTRKLVFTMPKADTSARKDQTLRVSYDYGYSIAYSYNISPGNWSDYSDITNFGPNELFCVYSYGDPALTAANIIKASLVNIAAYMGI